MATSFIWIENLEIASLNKNKNWKNEKVFPLKRTKLLEASVIVFESSPNQYI